MGSPKPPSHLVLSDLESNGAHKTTLWICDILSLRFLTIFFFNFFFKLTIVPDAEIKTSILCKRIIVERNGVKFVTHE